jgi:hypothetical protein
MTARTRASSQGTAARACTKLRQLGAGPWRTVPSVSPRLGAKRAAGMGVQRATDDAGRVADSVDGACLFGAVSRQVGRERLPSVLGHCRFHAWRMLGRLREGGQTGRMRSDEIAMRALAPRVPAVLGWATARRDGESDGLGCDGWVRTTPRAKHRGRFLQCHWRKEEGHSPCQRFPRMQRRGGPRPQWGDSGLDGETGSANGRDAGGNVMRVWRCGRWRTGRQVAFVGLGALDRTLF